MGLALVGAIACHLSSLFPAPIDVDGKGAVRPPPAAGLDLFQQVDLGLARRGAAVQVAINAALGLVDQAGEKLAVDGLEALAVPAVQVEARRPRLRSRTPFDEHTAARRGRGVER